MNDTTQEQEELTLSQIIAKHLRDDIEHEVVTHDDLYKAFQEWKANH